MKIAVVVVTFNRLECLQKCLAAIKIQTFKVNEIIVVNNSSTDGTEEWLNSCMGVRCITQPNLGGAGGFHTGIKIARNEGNDFIWCMDDDGKPEVDCLEKLIGYIDKADMIAPVVLDGEDPDNLSFEISYKENAYIKYSELCEKSPTAFLENVAKPFNGVLFSGVLIDKIGLPKKELFIWGDEYEYYLRILCAGFKILTILKAKFYHPYDRVYKRRTVFSKFLISYQNNKKRDFIRYRNNFYIYRKYSQISILKDFLKYTWFFMFTLHFDIGNLILFYQAATYGMLENWEIPKYIYNT